MAGIPYASAVGETDDQRKGSLVVVDTPAEVRELHAWLRREPELRGGVRLLESPPPTGALGPVAEAVQVLAGAPVAAVAGAVIAWLRYRTSDVKITVKRPDGTEVQVSAARIKTLNAEQTLAVTAQIETALNNERPLPVPEESAGG
ncbi:hypothetical protein ABZ297_44560 [Nonomuraea sp. NPDC005983]|uniref:effector-associated constant component EACC1 n=1 Tax=Nonomuraea sp. NPDC005983 TaxID=3155595 RepID=UPI0033A6F38A